MAKNINIASLKPLEKIVYNIFFEKHGNPYASDKVVEIKGMSSAEVIEWSTTHLDPKNRSAFFRAVGIDASVETSSALRRAFCAARQA